MTFDRKHLNRLCYELTALDGRLGVLQGVGVKVKQSQRVALKQAMRMLSENKKTSVCPSSGAATTEPAS